MDEPVTQGPKSQDFLLEEFKLLATNAQQHIQMLLTWFSFFFAFELVALGWILGVANKPGEGITAPAQAGTKNILIVVFLVKHVISVAVLYAFGQYLNGVHSRMSAILKIAQTPAFDPIRYKLYMDSLWGLCGALILTGTMWTLQLSWDCNELWRHILGLIGQVYHGCQSQAAL